MRKLWSAVAMACVLAVACGGSVTSTPKASPSDADSGVTSTTGPALVAACPTTPPADQTSCPTAVTCEYGAAFDFTCNTLAICDDTKRWTIQGGACKDPNPGIGPGCPSDFASATGACTTDGTICDYPEGRCGCAASPDSGPGQPGQPPPEPTTVWDCQAPLNPGCPATRPRNGEPCNVPDANCNYGAPCVAGSVYMTCSEGSWAGDLQLPCGGAG